MKIFTIFVFFLIAITLYSFSFGIESRSKSDILSDRLIKKISEQLCRKYNMTLVGIGGGAKNEKIRQISIAFGRYGEPINVEQSRKIMLDCIQVYLKEINSNKEIQPYLINRPYTAENLDISILNFYPDGSITLDPYVGDISEIQGSLYYRTRSGLNEPYKSEYKETYEEALAKVKQNLTMHQDANKKVDNKDEAGVAK